MSKNINCDYKEINYPSEQFDGTFKSVIKYIKDNHIIKKTMIETLFNKYIEQYFKVILSSDIFYRFDFKTSSFIIDERKYIKDYIVKSLTPFNVEDKEDNTIKTFTIKPYELFNNYVIGNGWELVHDVNKPTLYEKIEEIRGCKITTKYINDAPRIPYYLIEDYKNFEEYEDKYKDFVYKFFELIKYSLCSNDETDYEYMKNWTINKSLLIRNETVIVLQSPAQGIGKTTFAQFLKEYYGKNSNLVEVSGHFTWLTDRFNTNLKNKILMSIEEMPKDTKTSWINSFDKLKNFINNQKIMIEGKGKDGIECPNFIDFVITTNHYGGVPLEQDNRRYFIPTSISIKDDKVEELCRAVNSIVKNDKMNEKEKQIYFKCFYSYCKENYNPEYDPLDIPVTKAMIINNDKQMPLLFKYIKINNLMNKKDLYKDEKEDKYYFKVVVKHMAEDMNEFINLINGHPEELKRINYYQIGVNNFITSLNTNDNKITSKALNQIIKTVFKDYKNIEYGQITAKIDNKLSYFKIYYDDLLEYYNDKGYVDLNEYEKLNKQYIKPKDEDEFIDYKEEKINELQEINNKQEDKIKQLEEEIERLKKLLENNGKPKKEVVCAEHKRGTLPTQKEVKTKPNKKEIIDDDIIEEDDDFKKDIEEKKPKPKGRKRQYKKLSKEEINKQIKEADKEFNKNVKNKKINITNIFNFDDDDDIN